MSVQVEPSYKPQETLGLCPAIALITAALALVVKAGFASVVHVEAQRWQNHALLYCFLFAGQQWCSLAVLADHLPAWRRFAMQEPGKTDGQRDDKECACNCNGRDGLEMQVRDLAGKLVETSGCKMSEP